MTCRNRITITIALQHNNDASCDRGEKVYYYCETQKNGHLPNLNKRPGFNVSNRANSNITIVNAIIKSNKIINISRLSLNHK